MLLGFSCKNFKTYREETVFSMVPENSTKLEYSILKKRNPADRRRVWKALSSSVIYGPNASGKTNIIAAMDLFRCLILSGSVRNVQDSESANPAIDYPNLIPNRNAGKDPAEFAVEFVLPDGLKIEYRLGIDFGGFMEQRMPESFKVVLESLLVNDKNVFYRTSEELTICEDPIRELLIEDWNEKMKDIARKNILPGDLFLTNGFKSLVSSRLSESITWWTREQFRTILGAQSIYTFPVGIPRGGFFPLPEKLAGAVRNFGIHQNDLGFYQKDGSPRPVKLSLLNIDGENRAIEASLYESLGTLRMLDIFPIILEAFQFGKTLVFDELDASLHPTVIMNLISAFHNDEINVNHAQLIFNTHNPIFLNSRFFRPDEIKFVDRDEETGESELYQLSDFREERTNPAGSPDSYMKNYFIHRYGAIREVDLAPFLRSQNAETGREAMNEKE